MAVYHMCNHAQNYDWGSRRMLPALQAANSGPVSPSEVPVAEIWMGTHPRGPSLAETGLGHTIPVTELLRRDGAGDLPFLFKILTAERGLSIQTHPSRRLAGKGFERENAQGIALDAPHRTYRDRNHKPELLCAVNEFWGLRGFRPLAELQSEMEQFARILQGEAVTHLRDALQRFVEAPGASAWREAVAMLLRIAETGETAPFERALEEYCGESAAVRSEPQRDNRYWWCRELLRQFPGDAGAAAPLYLNLVHLDPGEAIFLEAGVLHAYLYGAGVELMASSDNVLRAGCTSKHVDRPELLRTLGFSFEPAKKVEPDTVFCGEGEFLRYRTSAQEFELVRFSAPGNARSGEYRAPIEFTKNRGAAIVLSLGGTVQVSADSRDDLTGVAEPVSLASTESALVDYRSNRFLVEMRSGATVYVAGEPGAITCYRGGA